MPPDPGLVDPTLDLLPFFASLAKRGEGRAVLWLLSTDLYGSLHAGADPYAAAARLVEEHADEDWMESFARVMLVREPELVRALLERTRNPAVERATLLYMANDAYTGSIQDDRDAEYLAAHAAEGERLYCELLTRFSEGLRGNLVWPAEDAEEWRTHLFELEHLQVGHSAPALEARYANGEEASLAHYRGRIVVLYILGQYSAEEGDLELLNELAALGEPLDVLAISREARGERTIPANLTRLQVKQPEERMTPSMWDIGILPPDMILDARGTIRWRDLHGPRLRQAILELLAECSAAPPPLLKGRQAPRGSPLAPARKPARLSGRPAESASGFGCGSRASCRLLSWNDSSPSGPRRG